jgi:hypothetical protein
LEADPHDTRNMERKTPEGNPAPKSISQGLQHTAPGTKPGCAHFRFANRRWRTNHPKKHYAIDKMRRGKQNAADGG